MHAVQALALLFSSLLMMCAPDARQLRGQELRVIEYVVLGDYETAVGHLLASAPEKSARYYRDALCTLALAVRPRAGRAG